ncbi:MAG: undecaprenyl-diphosphate phosphatase [Clostridia bacterium]|nr:undecaprenyl-diphosphate phosphatase [Clostridia bacterium]
MVLDIIRTVIMGLVEGISEWLPISSTGHMILVKEFLNGKDSFVSNSGFFDLYLYVIQLGAIMAVVTLYFKKLNPFAPSKTKTEKRDTWNMWFKVIVGCIPAAVIGLALDSLMEQIENWQVVSAMLIVYGVAFIIVERIRKKTVVNTMDEMTYKTALLIGAFQVLSIIPGTSRSGATILGAMLLGCSRGVAAEFSFFMAIPVMVGVSLLKIAKFILEGLTMSMDEITVLVVGMIVAYIVSMIAIKFLMNFVKKHDFKAFGVYRIVLGALVILYFVMI